MMIPVKKPGGVTRWEETPAADTTAGAPSAQPATLRSELGHVLREHRLAGQATLRDVSGAAVIGYGYLSEIERGRKEASSEILGNLCDALGITLATVLRQVAERLEAAR